APRLAVRVPTHRVTCSCGGGFTMRIGRFATHALLSVFCSLIFVVSSLFSANAQQSLPDSPKPKIVTTPPKQASESSWPRTFASDADAFTIYQPQVDKWDGNPVDLYSPVTLQEARQADSDVVKGVDVKNDAPKVIIATKASMLVLIDGTPQMGDVPGTKLQSVINTRSIILYDSDERLYFLRVQERWLQAKALE